MPKKKLLDHKTGYRA